MLFDWQAKCPREIWRAMLDGGSIEKWNYNIYYERGDRVENRYWPKGRITSLLCTSGIECKHEAEILWCYLILWENSNYIFNWVLYGDEALAFANCLVKSTSNSIVSMNGENLRMPRGKYLEVALLHMRITLIVRIGVLQLSVLWVIMEYRLWMLLSKIYLIWNEVLHT